MQNVFDSIYYLGAELATLWNLGGTNVAKRKEASVRVCNAMQSTALAEGKLGRGVCVRIAGVSPAKKRRANI